MAQTAPTAALPVITPQAARRVRQEPARQQPLQQEPQRTPAYRAFKGIPAPRRVPRWWKDATVSVAWMLGLAVVALWVANGGLTNISALGDVFTSAGRITGLIASYLLLLQVFLMARVPVIEQAWGQDGLTRLHRWVGFGSFTLMLAHIGLITVGYAAAQWDAVVSTFVDVTLNEPGMLLAAAGTLALCMVVVTSYRFARRRLRYESWHLIHLYAYLGVELALPHQLWTGADFLASPAATWFWWGLYALCLGAVLLFRVLMPLISSAAAGLRVSAVTPEADGAVSVTVTGRGVRWLKAQGGQFFQWRFLDGSGSTRANPFSLSAAPGRNSLRFTAAVVGDGTSRIAGLKPGTRVRVEGPYGRMHAGTAVMDKSLLMGAGIGIAPMRALLETVPGHAGEVTVVHRHSTPDDAVLAGEISRLAEARGAQVWDLEGPRARRNRNESSWLPASWGHVSDAEALLHMCPDLLERDLYLCGSEPWMQAVTRTARSLGLRAEQIHCEHFAY